MIDILYFITMGIHIAIYAGFSLEKAQLDIEYLEEGDEEEAKTYLDKMDKIDFVQRMCWFGVVIATLGYVVLKTSH